MGLIVVIKLGPDVGGNVGRGVVGLGEGPSLDMETEGTIEGDRLGMELRDKLGLELGFSDTFVVGAILGEKVGLGVVG